MLKLVEINWNLSNSIIEIFCYIGKDILVQKKFLRKGAKTNWGAIWLSPTLEIGLSSVSALQNLQNCFCSPLSKLATAFNKTKVDCKITDMTGCVVFSTNCHNSGIYWDFAWSSFFVHSLLVSISKLCMSICL